MQTHSTVPLPICSHGCDHQLIHSRLIGASLGASIRSRVFDGGLRTIVTDQDEMEALEHYRQLALLKPESV